MEQVPFVVETSTFGTKDFAENPEPRLPCILIVDVSGSMDGEPIERLNEGLKTYKDELSAAILAFSDSPSLIADFSTA
jgi:hypothetical protein